MFRLEDNTPAVYTEQSRDFQLLCRMYDFVINNLTFSASSMQNILNPLKCDEKLLPLIAKRVGFFSNVEIDTKVLRYILDAFPTIMQDKGSELAIREAVTAILKSEHSFGYININNARKVIDSDGNIDNNSSYIVTVSTPVRLSASSNRALQEIFKYIIPAGYVVNIVYASYDPSKVHTDVLVTSSDVYKIVSGLQNRYNVRNSSYPERAGEEKSIMDRDLGAFDTREVTGASPRSDEPAIESITGSKSIK